jgi:hypothetical protein
MTTVAVVPETHGKAETTYRAIAGNKQSSGRTIGEAIDALTPQLEPSESSATLIVIQQQRPDAFFTAEQQQRREQLMTQWREAQDANGEFPAELQEELEQLVLAEVRAAGQRAASLLRAAAK